MFNIKDIFKKGVTAAGAWVGNTIGGPKGAAIGGEIAGSLFEKKIGGSGEFEVVNTAVSPPRFSKVMGFRNPGMAKNTRPMYANMKTVDADTLNAEWNYRLRRYYTMKRYYS